MCLALPGMRPSGDGVFSGTPLWDARERATGAPQPVGNRITDRVIQMLHFEGLASIPAWARLFAYFEGFGGVNEDIGDGNYGFYDKFAQYSEKIFRRPWNHMQDSVEKGACTHPFPLAVDENQMGALLGLAARHRQRHE